MLNESILKKVKSHETSWSLDLQNEEVNDDDMKLLAEAIEFSPGLQRLAIRSITQHGLKYLLAALKKNTSLRVLELSTTYSEEAFVELASQFISANATLQTFITKGRSTERLNAKTSEHIIKYKEIKNYTSTSLTGLIYFLGTNKFRNLKFYFSDRDFGGDFSIIIREKVCATPSSPEKAEVKVTFKNKTHSFAENLSKFSAACESINEPKITKREELKGLDKLFAKFFYMYAYECFSLKDLHEDKKRQEEINKYHYGSEEIFYFKGHIDELWCLLEHWHALYIAQNDPSDREVMTELINVFNGDPKKYEQLISHGDLLVKNPPRRAVMFSTLKDILYVYANPRSTGITGMLENMIDAVGLPFNKTNVPKSILAYFDLSEYDINYNNWVAVIKKLTEAIKKIPDLNGISVSKRINSTDPEKTSSTSSKLNTSFESVSKFSKKNQLEQISIPTGSASTSRSRVGFLSAAPGMSLTEAATSSIAEDDGYPADSASYIQPSEFDVSSPSLKNEVDISPTILLSSTILILPSVNTSNTMVSQDSPKPPSVPPSVPQAKSVKSRIDQTRSDTRSQETLPIQTLALLTPLVPATNQLPREDLNSTEAAKLKELLKLLEPLLQNPQYASTFLKQATTPPQHFTEDEITHLKKVVANNKILKNYLNDINKHPQLVQYYRALQITLDKTVASLNTVAGEYVQGADMNTMLIQIGQKGVGAIATLVGGPVGLGIGIAAGVVGFALNTINTRSIKILANQIAEVFPNSSQFGNILEALAIVLTVQQKDKILHAPAPLPLNAIYTLYLHAVAKFNGRDVPNEVDHLVTADVKKIMDFWQTLGKNPSFEEWVPILLESFGVQLPATLTVADLCGTQVPLLPVASMLPPNNTVVQTLTAQVEELQKEIQQLKTSQPSSAGITDISQKIVALSSELQQLQGAHTSTVDSHELAAIRVKVDEMARRLPSSSSRTLTVDVGSQMLIYDTPTADIQVAEENKQLRLEVTDMREEFFKMQALMEDMRAQLEYQGERLGHARLPTDKKGKGTGIFM